ncbi:hypothetical protein PybrP1_003812 [[Pythium] brassicae (nom. inval.)]|nr:hypothetical protein PybrP1_003812 [[Pythium] brassicae (nom. inval.)]
MITVSCAWVVNWCYSRGNLLSRKSPANQSDTEFIAGTALAAHFIFFAVLLLVQLPVLYPLRFVDMAESEKTHRVVLFCLGRLLKHTHRVFLLSLAITIGLLVVLRPEYVGADIGVGKFYAYSFVTHLNNTSISIATRRIVLEDTILGRSKQHAVRQVTGCRSATRFAKVFILTLPKAAVVVLGALYVRAISKYRIDGVWDFVVFTSGNLVLKNVVREIAKRGTQKLRVRNPQSIFLVAGMPTVLIDTQVRIVLQTAPGARYTLVWTFVMAGVEVITRFTKVVFTKKRLLRREIEASALASTSQSRAAGSAIASDAPTGSRASTPADAFARWKHQVLTFQIAESYANMSAEYIAIGCSTSILYFYWDHPKYSLGGFKKSERGTTTTESLLPWTHSTALGAQVLVEVLVDYVSCVLESSQGVDFRRIREYRVFLALLFVCLATMNIQFCALMYLTVH